MFGLVIKSYGYRAYLAYSLRLRKYRLAATYSMHDMLRKKES